MKAIILAAGRGSRMGILTDDGPKCLLKLKGIPLIEYQVKALKCAGVSEIALVTGYKSELLTSYGIKNFYNAQWNTTNMVYSLSCAREWLDESDCIISYSDIIYKSYIIKELMACDASLAVAYDPNWLSVWEKRFENPLDDAETFKINKDEYLTEIGRKAHSLNEIEGQYMGLLKFKKGYFARYRELLGTQLTQTTDMTTFLYFLIKMNIKIRGIKNKDQWFEFDNAKDISLQLS
jgi:L-glutamine-phosphate cytidylyltransferase